MGVWAVSRGAASAALNERRLIEGMREEVLEEEAALLIIGTNQDDLKIRRAELGEGLAAQAARCGGGGGVGANDDAAKAALAFRDRLEEGYAFRAKGGAVAGVLNVAAGDAFTIDSFQSAAHLVVGIGGVRNVLRGAGGFDEVLQTLSL